MATNTNTSLQIKITRTEIKVDFPYGEYVIGNVDETFNLTLTLDDGGQIKVNDNIFNLYGNIFDDKELTLNLQQTYVKGLLFEVRDGTQLSLPVYHNGEDTGKKYSLGVIEFVPNQIKEGWKIDYDSIIAQELPVMPTYQLKKDNWPKIKCGNHQFNTTEIQYSGDTSDNIVHYRYQLNENGIDFHLSFDKEYTEIGSDNAFHLTRSTPDVYITLDGNGNITTGNQKFSLEDDCVAVSLGYGNYDAPFLSVDLNGGVVEFAGTLAGYHVIAVDGIENVTNGDYLFYNKAFYNDHVKFDGTEGYFGSKLSNLKSGRHMFAYCEQLKYFPVDLSSLIDGSYMFSHCTMAGHQKDGYLCTDHQRPLLDNLEIGDGMFSSCYLLRYFESAVSTLISAKNMFANTVLQKFTSSLENLVYGNRMFYSCNLTSFKSNLNSLKDGTEMFDYCDKLKSFSPNLPSLTNGSSMFYRCSALTTFSPQLSSLTYGDSMFSGCYNLTAFSSDLSSLTNGSSMFYKCTALTDFNSDLSKLENFDKMFYGCTNLKYFDASLASITKGTDFTEIFDTAIGQTLQTFVSNLENLQSGSELFHNFKNLTTFDANLRSITDGNGMFSGCNNLSTFNSDLSSLTDGQDMFRDCTNLAEFGSDLNSLTSGSYMFYGCEKLETFNSDFISLKTGKSSLTNGGSMFRNCSNLASFTANLSSLTAGSNMFYNCTNLTTFNSDLSSLTAGNKMFYKCKLNASSLKNILETLPQSSSSPIAIGIDVSQSIVNGKTTSQQLQDFAKGVNPQYDEWGDLKDAFTNKGWTVTFQYGGTNSEITLSEDEQFRGVPIYAHLTEEENPEMAEYCTEDGLHFYNIDWGHDVTHPEDFKYFGSLLEACGYYGVIPKIYLEEV